MLLTREEMTFDFGAARLHPERDRDILRFIFSQFLYGEVTGIQIGHWLHEAPDLAAAKFLAKQAVEEMQHVGNFVRILSMLNIEPEPAHKLVRFLATGMMGESWPQHVATEMALGEGFVLSAMYGVIATLEHEEAVAILTRAARQEATHVAFGEERTAALVRDDEALRKRLLGYCLVWLRGVAQLGHWMGRKLDNGHPVLSQLPAFTAHTLQNAQLRIVRMGLCHCPPLELPKRQQATLIAGSFAGQFRSSLQQKLSKPLGLGRPGRRRLTDHYLSDPLMNPHADGDTQQSEHGV